MRPLWTRIGDSPASVAGFFTLLSWIAGISCVLGLIVLAIDPTWPHAKLAASDALDVVIFRLARTGWLMAQDHQNRYVAAESDVAKLQTALTRWRVWAATRGFIGD